MQTVLFGAEVPVMVNGGVAILPDVGDRMTGAGIVHGGVIQHEGGQQHGLQAHRQAVAHEDAAQHGEEVCQHAGVRHEAGQLHVGAAHRRAGSVPCGNAAGVRAWPQTCPKSAQPQWFAQGLIWPYRLKGKFLGFTFLFIQISPFDILQFSLFPATGIG